MKKLLTLITAIAMMMVTFAFVAPAANATEATRVENVSEITYGTASFEAEGVSKATAKVTSDSSAKIMLNVSTKPIPKKQIKRCWTVPVGTEIDNEGYWNGTLSVKKDYKVQKGDNTMCHKKGHGKQVFKKSCNNRVWGVPGGPKRPPRSLPVVKGKVEFKDRYVYQVEQLVKETVSGSASARVVIKNDKGEVVCEAGGSVYGQGYAFSWTSVTVRSRTVSEAQASGSPKAVITAQSNQDLDISAKNKAKVDIEGKVDAYCATTSPETSPPPPPPPVVYEKPLAEIWAGEHAVDENGTTTVWGRIKCDARLTCQLSRPTENSDLGEMVSWMQGTVEDGWLRYSGTWRNANTLPPGESTVTLTAIGTDSQGQTVTTTTTLKVVKVVHPET